MPTDKSTSSAESESYDNNFFLKCRLNHAPISHIERAQLHSLIDETTQALKRISDSGSRVRLSKILRFQRSLLSPIRWLPPDVMGEIFSFIVAGNPIKFGSRNNSTFDALAITWFCTWWRELALSQPALWSSMELSFDCRYTSEQTRFLKECVISRSSLMPLDLSLELPHYIGSPYSFTLESKAALNVLVDEVERWKHLKLLNFAEPATVQLVAVIISKQEQAGASSPLPLLQSLTLGPRDPHQIHDFDEIFMDCPSLRKLRIFRLASTHHDVAINIQNIVDLEIQICLNESLVHLLRACPLLQTLTVGQVDDSLIIHQEPFSHIHLTALNLSYIRRPFSDTAWIKFIRLPKLTHLDIRAHAHNSFMTASKKQGVVNVSYAALETTFDALLEMLLSSGCSLQTASIYSVFQDYRPSSKGCFLRFTDSIVDDFLAKLPVSSTGQSILTKALKAGVDAELDYFQ